MAYETHFIDGTEITPYLATAYAERFCEGENATIDDIFAAWSYICGTNLHSSLQGWYGRNIHHLIETECMTIDGTLNKELIKSKINEEL
jgi:imidazoleglycerol phosphate dehydratase HisB